MRDEAKFFSIPELDPFYMVFGIMKESPAILKAGILLLFQQVFRPVYCSLFS